MIYTVRVDIEVEAKDESHANLVTAAVLALVAVRKGIGAMTGCVDFTIRGIINEENECEHCAGSGIDIAKLQPLDPKDFTG